MSDLHLTRGDSYSLSFAVTDVGGSVVNLTGYSLWFTAKNAYTDLDAAAVMQFEISSGITVTSYSGGTGTIDIAPADWATYTGTGHLVWDLQAKASDDTVTTVERGRIWVRQDTTITTT